ncbi:MAG: nucleotidyltransferase [Sulfolobales archaeon]|nr:nucleotidyltransferase [Sulfolobales archaeon]MCX8185572.1 nucleotidyltransferase [Sulfolobales archaeon]MDW7969515.1 nucleotidyltransferase [Sulfolobales archaeon]
MGYDKNVLRNVLLRLRDLGVDGVLIGSTVLLLHLNVDEFEDDIDLFVTNFSPYIDEDTVRSISAKLGCELTQNEWGTPALYCIFNDSEVVVELHENVLDLYIPESVIRAAKEVKVMDVRVKCITIEDYVVLKARAGRDHDLEDLGVIADLIKNGRLRVDINFIKERVRNEFPDEEKLLLSRLKNVGFKV